MEETEKVIFVCSSTLLRKTYVKIKVDLHQVRPELGGGRKEFSMADADAFKDFEDTENFLSRLVFYYVVDDMDIKELIL